jgi:hypothetical protein
MSARVWEAFGKSMANTGGLIGQYMMQRAGDEEREAREIAREERALARTEAAAKKDADIYAEAKARAASIGEDRRFAKFKADFGQTDMPEEDLRKVFNEKKTDYVERYSKEKEDVLNEIRLMGGSSGLINQALESQKAAVTAETAADRLAFDQKKADKKEEADREANRIREKQIDAIIEKNKGGGESGSSNRKDPVTKAEDDLMAAKKNFKFREPNSNEKYGNAKAAYEREMQDAMANDPIIKRRQAELDRLMSGGGAAPARPVPTRTPTSGALPDLSSFLRR